MGKKKAIKDEKMATLEKKFGDIKGIRKKILGEAGDVAGSLKEYYKQRSAVSPDKMNQNLKSISSFLENFTRMMKNISSKIDSISQAINEINEKQEQIGSAAKSL